ncbi:MAG: ATP phosphoribosyltransferase [Candidatus Tokpelaia sp. JSC161]|nr:MAG: ATP phosphoribosyltransferase [Candidatus Tokpelaia sp. JSC161]
MKITLALPSKGRFKEKTLSLLKNAGYEISLSLEKRSYHAHVTNLPEIDILFLSASEIAHELGNGNINLGITGKDLIYENLTHPNEHIEIKYALGFGHANVVVAVPEIWHDVSTIADLDDVAADFRQHHGRRLRIATKYWRLTQQFLSQKHGIQLYRIVESLGATEGAPAAGSADVIVDITSSGATLAANKLKILNDGVILKSQACLIASRHRSQNIDIICKDIKNALNTEKDSSPEEYLLARSFA